MLYSSSLTSNSETILCIHDVHQNIKNTYRPGKLKKINSNASYKLQCQLSWLHLKYIWYAWYWRGYIIYPCHTKPVLIITKNLIFKTIPIFTPQDIFILHFHMLYNYKPDITVLIHKHHQRHQKIILLNYGAVVTLEKWVRQKPPTPLKFSYNLSVKWIIFLIRQVV